MWRLTLANGGLFPLSADYSVVMCGAWPGTLVTWPWRRLSMTYCCAQRLWSLICVTCRSCRFPDLVALSCCAWKGCLGPHQWPRSMPRSMAAVQAEDARASFLFVGDFNGHHQELLSSATTNRHGVAAFNFATVSGCDQLVVGQTHARGGTLDLLITDVPDLVRVSVVSSIGNSDHSSLSAVISMAQAVPNLCVSRKFFLKHQVN